MNKLLNNPTLHFDFSSELSGKNSLSFTNPSEIIWTNCFSKVSDCLAHVQKAVDLGFYVAGYMSYEAAYGWENRDHLQRDVTMPLLWFGVFDSPASSINFKEESFYNGDWSFNQTKLEYSHAIKMIQEAIERGETEQINYTAQFQANFTGCAYTLYKQLKNAQQADYCAYLDIGRFKVLSASPELFFHVKNGKVRTKPMKGTIHRGKTWEDDKINRQWLTNSPKNKTENDLITQLMIDELKEITNESSIRVIDQYKIEKYPTVYQMTSTIEADIRHDVSIIDILTTLFPCGSITGTPKQSAIELIAALEKNTREVYCGSIGYITPNKEAVFNVPIRTVIIDEDNHLARYGSGGGITINSRLEEEYQEVLTKSQVLHHHHESFNLLETFGLIHGDFLLFNEHIKRLKLSADYFDFHIDLHNIKNELMNVKHTHHSGKWRVRLVVDPDGSFTIDTQPMNSLVNRNVKLASEPINKDNIFHYHKTTNRKIYEHFSQKNPDVLDVLLWNNNLEITEFTIGNIVVDIEGELFTPPVLCGLLPGTFRDYLLRKGKIKERKILMDDLQKCSSIWLINSVREWVPVQLITETTR